MSEQIYTIQDLVRMLARIEQRGIRTETRLCKLIARLGHEELLHEPIEEFSVSSNDDE